ncbi:histidine kinase, partial [Promicromonospora citrea]|nr:histidine kinase [Promicromonospora citrea]
MDLTRHVDELQRQLSVAAAAGGDDARELAARLTAPLDAAARLVLLDALSTAAGEISAELAPGAVDVRLR